MSGDKSDRAEQLLHRALDVLDEDQQLATMVTEPADHGRATQSADPTGLQSSSLEALVTRCGGEAVRLPRLSPVVVPGESLDALKSAWPNVPDDILPQWGRGDVTAVFVAGLAGAFTSHLLKDKFAALHDGPFSKQHSGEIIDRVPGSGVGGFFHRLKHGHDLFNPFEIDWDRYAPQKGLVGIAASFWPWLRHLLQDTFSREGLPIPGNTVLRKLLLETIELDYNTYRSLLTVKMRDLVGATLTTAIIEGYVYAPAVLGGRVERWAGYRHLTLATGAHLVGVGAGLLLPTPSLNYGSAAAAAYFGAKLIAAIRAVDRILSDRDQVLRSRGAVLDKRDRAIDRNDFAIDAHGSSIEDFGERLKASMARIRPLTSAVPVSLPDADDKEVLAWLERFAPRTAPEGGE